MFFKTICCANIFFPGNPNSSQDKIPEQTTAQLNLSQQSSQQKFPNQITTQINFPHRVFQQTLSQTNLSQHKLPTEGKKTTEVPTQAGLGKGLNINYEKQRYFFQHVFSIKFWFIYIYIYIYLNMFDLFLCTPLIHFLFILFIHSFIYWFIECFLILWNVF